MGVEPLRRGPLGELGYRFLHTRVLRPRCRALRHPFGSTIRYRCRPHHRTKLRW